MNPSTNESEDQSPAGILDSDWSIALRLAKMPLQPPPRTFWQSVEFGRRQNQFVWSWYRQQPFTEPDDCFHISWDVFHKWISVLGKGVSTWNSENGSIQFELILEKSIFSPLVCSLVSGRFWSPLKSSSSIAYCLNRQIDSEHPNKNKN